MEFRVLQYFLAIAREESISAAAETLHITQPTLSRQIKELEDEFGKQLFVRGNRKITLTEEGMLLRKRAEEISSLVEKTQLEMNALDNELNGDIYIGGGETQGMRFIIKAIQRMQAAYPMVRFHLYSGNAEDVGDRLDKGLLDFGVFIEPANMSKYDFIKLPAKDVWGVLMRKDSPLAEKEYIVANDLIHQPIIYSSQHMVKNIISGWMQNDYDKLSFIASYNLIYNASLMVEDGAGYALTLDGLINTTGDSPLCFRPLKPKLEVGLALVWKKYQVFSKPAEYFLKELQSVVNEINQTT